MAAGKKGADERGEVLFELPIEGTGGNVVCTLPAKQIYLITFTSGADNRLISVCFEPIPIERSRKVGV